MVRQRAQEVRGQLISQLEGAAKDLSALLETARKSGGRLRCKACGSFIPGVSTGLLGRGPYTSVWAHTRTESSTPRTIPYHHV